MDPQHPDQESENRNSALLKLVLIVTALVSLSSIGATPNPPRHPFQSVNQRALLGKLIGSIQTWSSQKELEIFLKQATLAQKQEALTIVRDELNQLTQDMSSASKLQHDAYVAKHAKLIDFKVLLEQAVR